MTVCVDQIASERQNDDAVAKMEGEKDSNQLSQQSNASASQIKARVQYEPFKGTSDAPEYMWVEIEKDPAGTKKDRAKLRFRCRVCAKQNVFGNGVTNIRSNFERKNRTTDISVAYTVIKQCNF